MILSILVTFVIANQYEAASYYTSGDKRLLTYEGQSVQSLSGYRSVIDISSKECAEGCVSLKEQCNCCDSFTYNTFRRECFYKLRNSRSYTTTFNSDGWQSYTLNNLVGFSKTGSAGSLQSKLNAGSSAYIHYGFNQLARSEGFTLRTFDGKEYLSRVTPDDCAEECNRVIGCNSFSFNPNLDRDGRCYMKQVTTSSRAVSYNSDGWRTYWKDSNPKSSCFCTCKNNRYCVICVFDDVCFER
eukprot:TRINITY_DN1286_c0_g1_i2.p1 TRINITY_DN1286_c0_g1~~TRINITY_DN1286_c0_g1_i2.p1  ORF type:complete len:242 (-),score=-5.85 TRINITY_DN1286_c0_g1_i2:365-1090(-)